MANACLRRTRHLTSAVTPVRWNLITNIITSSSSSSNVTIYRPWPQWTWRSSSRAATVEEAVATTAATRRPLTRDPSVPSSPKPVWITTISALSPPTTSPMEPMVASSSSTTTATWSSSIRRTSKSNKRSCPARWPIQMLRISFLSRFPQFY